MSSGKYESPNTSKKKKIRVIWLMTGVCVVLLAIALCLTFFSKGVDRQQTPEMGNASTAPIDTTETEPAVELLTEDAESTNTMESEDQEFYITQKEEGDVVKVTTRYGSVEYPAAFSDVVQIRTTCSDGLAILKFEGLIGNNLVKLFDICYGDMGGEVIKQIQLDNGDVVNVYLVIYDQPQNLSEDEQNTFFAAQEILNDVLAQIIEHT